MKMLLLAVALLFSVTGAATAQEKQTAHKSTADASNLETKVRKVWEDFKNKNKDGLASALADGYRNFEEGSSTFSDKKAEVASVDEFEMRTYTLKDFTVRPLGPHSALVTYVAHYEGKSGNEAVTATSEVGEVWVHEGSDWKAFYVQETTVK